MSSTRTQLLAGAYERLLRPVLFQYGDADPEHAHEAMLKLLARMPARGKATTRHPVEVAGIKFPNRVGLAAGLDKDGVAAPAWASLGFGFAELGTVTAHPQPGNPKPRLYRLVESRAIINRMGFNNQGAAALAIRLASWQVKRGNQKLGIPLGISIGKSKTAALPEAEGDYLASVRLLRPYADYFAINVSSPNTLSLRLLQEATRLTRLLAAIVTAADGVPVFVKLAPDLEAAELRESIAAAKAGGAAGFIATNTTLQRDGLRGVDQMLAGQKGGLSGAPLRAISPKLVSQIASQAQLPVIGSGGIMTPSDARRMFDAGATLLQLYTGFIYSGPGLIRGIQELDPGTPK